MIKTINCHTAGIIALTLLAVVSAAGCIPHAIPYVAPVPENPYPQEMFGHMMLNDIRPGEETDQGIGLAGKVTVSFTRNQFRYHGTGMSWLSHENSRDLGTMEVFFQGIRKVNRNGGSVLIADKVYIRVLRFDGRPFSEKEYKSARFNNQLKYEALVNMMHAGNNIIFAEKGLSRGDAEAQRKVEDGKQ